MYDPSAQRKYRKMAAGIKSLMGTILLADLFAPKRTPSVLEIFNLHKHNYSKKKKKYCEMKRFQQIVDLILHEVSVGRIREF